MGELHAGQRGLVQEKVAWGEIGSREQRNWFPDLKARQKKICRAFVFRRVQEFLFHIAFLILCSADPLTIMRIMEIRLELPGVKLGVIEADNVRVTPGDEALARLMQEICDRKSAEFTVESLAEAQPVRAVRAMFREWDMDPSKYRPSSEALLRRVVQGKGLYRVSNVVDVGNLCSIESGWPFGCYDRDKIKEPVVFRHGAAGEQYEGIGKRTWHLEGRPVLADPDGPFGSPISDSTRSMITEAAHEILMVIYAPSGAADSSIEAAMDQVAERLSLFAGARELRNQICS